MKTTVVHCKKDHYDVYIGRGHNSIWGNPYKIDKTHSREEVIKLYEEYVRNNPFLMSKVKELKGKILGCWCAPLPCHGDVLAKIADEE